MTIVHNSSSSRAHRYQAGLTARQMLQINSEGICLIAIKGSWRKGLCFKPELQGDNSWSDSDRCGVWSARVETGTL